MVAWLGGCEATLCVNLTDLRDGETQIRLRTVILGARHRIE